MESEIDAELRFHIESRAEDLVRGGLSRAEAMRLARIEFGGIERVKEESREALSANFVESLVQDIRYAFRCLRKDRRFALIAIFALALGIGSTSVVFSVIYNGLLRPFPYKDASRLTTFSLHDLRMLNSAMAEKRVEASPRRNFISPRIISSSKHDWANE
jgi:hypothetical protein